MKIFETSSPITWLYTESRL